MDIGHKLGGRYKIIRHIGSGGMANVYLGHDLILERDVAIKILRLDFVNNQDALRRFQREALAATQLVHPNIVSVFDVDEENELQYIVMEYVDGMDLKKYIEQHGKVEPEKAVQIMDQILSAVALAHRNRIIHRDIKPQNVLIDKNEKVKITDFGIAVALSETSITQTNTLLGSVHYLSPEQARGGMATAKSDIYALGIVLYELLAGEVPFDGESAVSIALKHFQEEIPSLRQKDPAIPQSLENVILKATAKEPSDRYQNCEEMIFDLETSLDPARASESVYVPASMLKETKVLEPIKNASFSQEKKEDTMRIVPAAADQQTAAAPMPEPPQKARKKRRGLWLGLLGLLLAGSAVLLFYWNNSEPEQITVPNLSGMNEADAIRELTSLGFQLGDITEEYSDEVAEGQVIGTRPETGTSVEEAATIDLVLSEGEEPFVLEDYVGEEYETVRNTLREAGFSVERTEQYDAQTPAGSIISQDFDEGDEVLPSETTLSFVVSLGAEVFTMSDLTGYNQTSVEDYASQYGLTISFQEESSEDVAEGLVISQSLAPGSSFNAGQEITVILSTGPAEPEYQTFSRTITIPYQAPADTGSESESSEENSDSAGEEDQDSQPEESGDTANHIVVYVEDVDNSLDEVFREFDITEDRELTINFRILTGESASYRVERDGTVIMDESGLTQ